MKRTKHINYTRFRKHWCVYRVASVAITTVSACFLLTGCEKSDENISLYMNSDKCTNTDSSSLSEGCIAGMYHNDIQKKLAQNTTKNIFNTDSKTELNKANCTEVPLKSEVTSESKNNDNIWMPLITGYMMGNIMGNMIGNNYAEQTPYNSDFNKSLANRKSASNNSHTVIKQKENALPKLATTKTIIRNGFGDTVAKLNAKHSNNSTSLSSNRTLGS